jgi:hypothetical protein
VEEQELCPRGTVENRLPPQSLGLGHIELTVQKYDIRTYCA